VGQKRFPYRQILIEAMHENPLQHLRRHEVYIKRRRLGTVNSDSFKREIRVLKISTVRRNSLHSWMENTERKQISLLGGDVAEDSQGPSFLE
jgi:hypothetical protein